MERFILDNGKIRDCDKNISLMKFHEYFIWTLVTNKFGIYDLWYNFKGFSEIFKEFIFALLGIVYCVVLYPVWVLHGSVYKYSRAKKNVKRYGK